MLEKLCLDSVSEFYGKANSDGVGGGRPSAILPCPSRLDIEQQIDRINKKGIRFNYLLNATCLGEREGEAEVRGILEWLSHCKVSTVTVARPQLLRFIKKHYPSFKVCVSTQANVNDRHSAAAWEAMGADSITLSFVDVNRDFKTLREIRKTVACELRLIANLECLRGCPWSRYHAHIASHASQSGHASGGFYMDYCFLKCNSVKLRNPVEFLRSGWIRPEDIKYYEEAGINAFKLVSRSMSTERLAKIVQAYTAGTYEGNLFDLFSEPSGRMAQKIKFFFRPGCVNIFRLYKYRGIAPLRHLTIDNRSLDGFISHFLKADCRLENCGKCGYCSAWADRVFTESPGYRQRALKYFQGFLDALTGGGLFFYR